MNVSKRTAAIEASSAELCTMLKFVSTSSEDMRFGICKLLDKLAAPSDGEAVPQLARFTDYFLRKYDEWPGPKEFRAVWCTQFPPADGYVEDLALDHPLTREAESRFIEAEPDSRRALPPIDDPEMRRMVAQVARKRSMPEPSKPKRIGPTRIGELMG